MFLLCALSLAGEWRSANIDWKFEFHGPIPTIYKIPLPVGSCYQKPIELSSMEVQADPATYTFNKDKTEEIVKTIVGKYGEFSHKEAEIRNMLNSEDPERLTVIRTPDIPGRKDYRTRQATMTVVQLDYQVLSNGMRQVTVKSAKCIGSLYVDCKCYTYVPLYGRKVWFEVPREITSFERRKIAEVMIREIEKKTGMALQRRDPSVIPK